MIKSYSFERIYCKYLKLIRKIIYIIISVTILGVAISGLALVIYKDHVINLLKNEINLHIKSRLDVESIDLILLKGFPNISIKFTNVRFYSAFEQELLLESKNIYFVLNLLDLFQNDITVERLEVEDAKLRIHKNLKGEKNYDVFIESNNEGFGESIFDIKSIEFSNVELVNIDDFRKIEDVIKIENLYGSVNLNDANFLVKINANAIITKTRRPYLNWIPNKKISLNTVTSYVGNVLKFTSCEVEINNSIFNFNGFIELNDSKDVSIELIGDKILFADIITLLPKTLQKRLAPYNAKGKIGVDLTLEGNLKGKNWPVFETSIRLREFEINHIDLKFPMTEIYLDGKISVPDMRKLETGTLKIDKFSASIDGNKLSVFGNIKDFKSPKVEGKVVGNVDINWAKSILITDTLYFSGSSNGNLGVDLGFDFKTSFSDQKVILDSLNVRGSINFYDVGLANIYNLPLKNLNGEAIFTTDKIEVKELNGVFGRSDFMINGYVNVAQLWDLGNSEKIDASINLISRKIELDEIVEIIELQSDSTTVEKKNPFKFTIDLNLEVNQIDFRRFQGKNFLAKTVINQNGIKIIKGTSEGIGGKIALSGMITNQFNKDYFIEVKTLTQSVKLDSLFYIFNNFKQDFITYSAIKGELTSEVYTSMYFTKDWSFKRDLLYVEGKLLVKNGELNNFKPIISLSSYLKNEDENLAKLRFSDVENNILIANDTVFISDMFIGTNVRNIEIGGYHTLNQQIDYRLSVPVISNKKDRDVAFGEVKDNEDGKLYMPFRIKGTSTNYKVTYDLKRVGSGLFKGVKKEFSEIRKSDLKVAEIGDTLLLEEEDFFDWDNN